MECKRVVFTRHALTRMFERKISVDEVAKALAGGEIIRSYPKDLPIPSSLVLGDGGGRALHVVAAQEPQTGVCYVITAYVPGPMEWTADLRRKL